LNVILKPTPVSIHTIAPPSKSNAIRLIVASMLALKSNSNLQHITLKNFAQCNDINAAINIATHLGFQCDKSKLSTLIIKRNQISSTNTPIIINCGESALCYRIFTIIAPLFVEDYKIVAEGSLINRIKNFTTN